MQYFILSIVLAISATGCARNRVLGQPRLHIPSDAAVDQAKADRIASRQSLSSTNRTSTTSTNANHGSSTGSPTAVTVLPATNIVIAVDQVTTTNANLTAFLQIAADQDVEEEFGTTFASCFYVGEVIVENRNEDPFLAYGASMDVNVAYYVTEADWVKNASMRELMVKRFRKDYILSHRRPCTYSDILAIFEYQRRSNPKQQFVDYLRSFGEIAAGASVFVTGPTYPKAVAFTTGIITTELEKRLLWDILLHAKNLESRSFKDVEEIPARSSIHRLVFFPKRGIPGVLDGSLVYLSSFSEQTMRTRQPVLISGSLIKKTQSTATGEIKEIELK